MQAPFWHDSGLEQVTLQAPQFSAALRTSMQLPLAASQQTFGDGQSMVPQGQLPLVEQPDAQHRPLSPQAAPPAHLHWPPSQLSPGLHAWPQAPQLKGLEPRSTQPRPLQQVWPEEQAEPLPQWQLPATHESAESPQACPQLPQLAGSLSRSVQTPWQQVCPVLHTAPLQRHSPITHMFLLVQAGRQLVATQ